MLVVGVIAFPLLFETQPRPVPVDIPMVIPSREGAAPLTPPARPSRTDSGTIAPAPGAVAPASVPAAAMPTAAAPTMAPVPPPALTASAGHAKAIERIPDRPPEKTGSVQPAAKPASAAKPVPPAPPPKPEAKAESPKPEVKKAEPKKPEPKAEPKPETKAEAKTGRFVVQVGAYADEASTREARQRVEKLGLKTFTQTVEVQGAKRIRVRIGPFETVQEANKALATLRAAKLPGAVLSL